MFVFTSRNIELYQRTEGPRKGYYLRAECADGGEGGWKSSSFWLDGYISNNHGTLQWIGTANVPLFGEVDEKGCNFSYYARNVKLIDNGCTLYAELATGNEENGGWLTSTLQINKRIANDHGNLKYVLPS